MINFSHFAEFDEKFLKLHYALKKPAVSQQVTDVENDDAIILFRKKKEWKIICLGKAKCKRQEEDNAREDMITTERQAMSA